MIDTKELQREESFWDSIGAKWINASDESNLAVGDASQFLSGSSVVFHEMMKSVGPLEKLRVLDYGCGSGWLSTYLAQRGATVEGFDISGKLVELGMLRARANGVAESVKLRKMIAERLEYPDGHFQLVIGISILHHISLEEGSRELARVLAPGGRAFFIEPLGESSALDWIRNHLFRIHHGHIRVVDAEHPLTYENIRTIGLPFRETRFTEFQLTEMIARVTGDRFSKMLHLHQFDTTMLRWFPQLKRYCRLVVISYSR
jgi:SAM-dependent methyltransferase